MSKDALAEIAARLLVLEGEATKLAESTHALFLDVLDKITSDDVD